MKKLTCDLCDYEAQGETFEEWMNALKPHYKEAHADDMQKHATLPAEKQKALMQKWMSKNRSRFESQTTSA